MAEIKHVALERDRSLLDPNFSGYKLSLDSLGVRKTGLDQGPKHIQPSADMFSFLHAKLFGEHNHLTLDTYNENEAYFISGSGVVFRVDDDGDPGEVWTLPESGLPRTYNPRVVFPSADCAVISDGAGTMFILETGNRNEGRPWKSIFHDAVCGKERPFEVRYAILQGDRKELEVVLQYVEDRDKLDLGEISPQPTGESTFFNCLEWLSFQDSEKGWMMERVRRIVSHGGYNYVSIIGTELAVSAEKKTVMAFDSLHPAELVGMELEVKKQEENAHFYWKQTEEDLEIWFYVLSDTVKSQVSIEVVNDVVEAKLSGKAVFKGQFGSKIEADSWTWTLDAGKVGIMMSKEKPGRWTNIWIPNGGPKGLEVTDDTVDTILPHLTSENPISTGDPTGEPAFNAQELESVDDTMEENSVLVWQSGATSQNVASLSGQQHLMVIPQTRDQPPALCIRHDVDGLVWKLDNCKLQHIAAFPALGYVQAGKQSRKFLVAPHDFSYSAICDASRHIYIYRQPKPLDSGTELRNRKSGHKVEGVAVQQVVTLDNNEEILGLQATPTQLMLVTQHGLYRIRVN